MSSGSRKKASVAAGVGDGPRAVNRSGRAFLGHAEEARLAMGADGGLPVREGCDIICVFTTHSSCHGRVGRGIGLLQEQLRPRKWLAWHSALAQPGFHYRQGPHFAWC